MKTPENNPCPDDKIHLDKQPLLQSGCSQNNPAQTDYRRMIAVTNRHLVKDKNLIQQLEKVALLHPKAVVLREKDLSPNDYLELAALAVNVCKKYDIPLILHNFAEAALALSHPFLHLPLPLLLQIDKSNPSVLRRFRELGTSVHSADELSAALRCGVTYVFAGNIYETDCKAGLPGKGEDFLCEICALSTVPVYAIGGVTCKKMPALLSLGAAGGCMMSGFMKL